MAAPADMEPTNASDDSTAEADQVSRLKRYDKRVEEWLASLKDEAEQRSPEVLGALAAKAKDVAEYLDKMAERVRSKQEADDSRPSLPAQETSDADESQRQLTETPDRALPDMDDPSTTGPGPGVPTPVPEPPGPDLIPEPEPGPEPQPPDVQPSPDPQIPPDPRPPELPPQDPHPPANS